jgi:uncharacterized membrane protein YeaQ/YmgE (transglycosylase-associated protein family)
MRAIVQIADLPIGASATADTGTIEVDEFHTITAIVSGITGAITGAIVTNYVAEDATNVPVISQTGAAIGAVVVHSLGREAGTSPAPVPRRIRVTATTIAAGALRLSVWGVRDEPETT